MALRLNCLCPMWLNLHSVVKNTLVLAQHRARHETLETNNGNCRMLLISRLRMHWLGKLLPVNWSAHTAVIIAHSGHSCQPTK